MNKAKINQMIQCFSLIFKFTLFLFFYCLTIGCNSKSKLINKIYFNQKNDSLLATIVKNYEPIIFPHDRLLISVTALDPASVSAFNLNNLGVGTNSYNVENDGTIKFPQLGKIYVQGYALTRLADSLTIKIAKFVNDPTVIVQFSNFKITVLGEVGRPGPISFPEGRANLAEVISISGDLTPNAKLDSIRIIREKNGIREFGNINILSINSFNSPYYNLQQNDIVYVEPIKPKSVNTDQTFLRSLSIFTTVLSTISTLFFLFNNIIK